MLQGIYTRTEITPTCRSCNMDNKFSGITSGDNGMSAEQPPSYNDSMATDKGDANFGNQPPAVVPTYGYPPSNPTPYGYPAANPAMHGAPYTSGPQPYGQPPVSTVVVSAPGVLAANTMHIDDHCTSNVVFTLFCCWMIGIVAILKSDACRKAKLRGDVAEAERLSQQARKWGLATLFSGIVFVVIYCIFVAIVVLFSS